MAETGKGEPLLTSWVPWNRFCEVIADAKGSVCGAIRIQVQGWQSLCLDEVYFDFYAKPAPVWNNAILGEPGKGMGYEGQFTMGSTTNGMSAPKSLIEEAMRLPPEKVVVGLPDASGAEFVRLVPEDEARRLFSGQEPGLFLTPSRSGNSVIGCSRCETEFMRQEMRDGRCPNCGVEFVKESLR